MWTSSYSCIPSTKCLGTPQSFITTTADNPGVKQSIERGGLRKRPKSSTISRNRRTIGRRESIGFQPKTRTRIPTSLPRRVNSAPTRCDDRGRCPWRFGVGGPPVGRVLRVRLWVFNYSLLHTGGLMSHARTQHPNAQLPPRHRRNMVDCVLDGGWTIEAAAEWFQIDAKTVTKWRDRFLAEGEIGLLDRGVDCAADRSRKRSRPAQPLRPGNSGTSSSLSTRPARRVEAAARLGDRFG